MVGTVGSTVNCPKCRVPVHISLEYDEESEKAYVQLCCHFCGRDVEAPEWLRLALREGR